MTEQQHQEAERDRRARKIYRAVTEGTYVTNWCDLTPDRKERWLRAADRSYQESLRIAQRRGVRMFPAAQLREAATA